MALLGLTVLGWSTLGAAQALNGGTLALPQVPAPALASAALQSAVDNAALPVEPLTAQQAAADPLMLLAASRRTGASRVVKATAYNSEVGQTDNSPFITATGTRVRPGVIALSRDLLRVFPYGTRVTIQDSAGLLRGRTFIVEDTMNVRMANTIDIWMGSRAQALRWGSRTVKITAVR
nr:hypothetical protein [Deinococcus irradiatisoli]